MKPGFVQVELHMFFAQSSDLPVEILTLLQVKKSLFLRIKSCSSPLGARSAVEKTLGTKLGPEGRRCFAWQCSRMQPVDSPCEVRPSKRTCIEKERQPIYNYTVVYVGVYIYI